MNSQSIQLANRFREVILNGRWIANTNFKDQLINLKLEEASSKVGNLNTITMLTFHIHYYIAGVIQVFEGGALDIKDQYSFDLPELASENDWEELKNRLWRDAERFAQLVEQIPDNKLNDVFVDIKYGSYLRNIEGIIEHSYYHLGQVALIKKLIDATQSKK